MTAAGDLARMVPGFEFLQGLMKNAGGALPGMQQWVAPTLDPEELDKRIQELRTVQFWLENNAKLLGTTIQALEVQRMTLGTLQRMNLPLADLRQALTAKTPAPAPAQPAATQAPAAIDPMQWWGALTQQFSEIAAKAAKDSAADTVRNLAGAVVKQSVASAGSTLKKAAALPAKAARAAAPRKRAR
jgi:hypothetical protein